jgi:hypothetical protein
MLKLIIEVPVDPDKLAPPELEAVLAGVSAEVCFDLERADDAWLTSRPPVVLKRNSGEVEASYHFAAMLFEDTE